MTRGAPSRFILLWALSLGIVLAAMALGITAFVVSDRRTVMRRAGEQALLDASLAAQSLDAVMRAAWLELESATARFPAEKAIVEAALAIHEEDNVYLLDGDGAVAATAYRRRAPSLTLAGDALARLASGARLDVRVAEAPAEGGLSLALVGAVPGEGPEPRFAAVLFTASSIMGRLVAIGTGSFEAMSLVDSGGGSLVILQGTSVPPRAPELQAAVALASFPLTVRTSADEDLVLEAWRSRTATILASGAAMAILLLGMFGYGLRLWSQGERAAILQKEVERRDVLFREVNHRIKNNLMIVQTVLALGKDRLEEGRAGAADTLESAMDRVRAIALLHEQLYRRKGADHDFGAYMDSLAGAIADAYGRGGPVALECVHDSGLELDMDRAVLVAIMLNELVTNAFKHAFAAGEGGRVRMEARATAGGGLRIEVSDDGKGMDAAAEESGGIGTMLIGALAGQAGATIGRSAGAPRGTVWTIALPPGAGGEPARP